MVETKDEVFDSKPIYTIYTTTATTKSSSPNSKIKTIALVLRWPVPFSSSMKRSVRPVFSLLLLLVVVATLGSRVVIRNGFGSSYGNEVGGIHFVGFGSDPNDPPLDFPLFNSTLLKLAEIDDTEPKLSQEVKRLVEGNLGSLPQFRTFATWRRFFSSLDMRVKTSKGMLVNRSSPRLNQVESSFKRALGDWAKDKKYQPEIMDELVDLVKVPIDKHNGLEFDAKRRTYKTCAVVGNSGILLSKEFGKLIDSHQAVIRLNNARIDSYQKNVGSKTSFSFVNSNILHLCARRDDCFCHPYGVNVPIVMYMCQPAQFLDYVVCDSSHKAPLIVTNPQFDVLCSRIVKYYSIKRFADKPNKTLEQWRVAHDGQYFHYSSGMQAVMLALGICDEVSLFGFGKSTSTKHHYHTNQKAELTLHDYEAEYDFYRDLVERPRAIPFISRAFKFPPVVIHR